MSLSRRSFLAGAIATSVYASLWSIDSAKAKITAGSKKEDKELLMKMVRTLYPHDSLKIGYNELSSILIHDWLSHCCSERVPDSSAHTTRRMITWY